MKNEIVYVVDDSFRISEEVVNMSKEEMERQIRIMEEAGRRERDKIKERKSLLVI